MLRLALSVAAICYGRAVGLLTSQLARNKCNDNLPVMSDTQTVAGEHLNWLNKSVDFFVFPKEDDIFISADLLKGSGWDLNINEKLCKTWQQAGRVGHFLDLGGNLGTYTIPMAVCLADTKHRVISVEGMPRIASHLAAAVQKNRLDNVCMYQVCVGEKEGEVTMHLDGNNKGHSSVSGSVEGDKNRHAMMPVPLWKIVNPELQRLAEDMKIRMTTVDSLLASNNDLKTVMVAKVDIEGSEGHMLKGAESFFSRYPPCYLLIELRENLLRDAGTPIDGVLKELQRFGYDADMSKSDKGADTYLFPQRDMAACQRRVAGR